MSEENTEIENNGGLDHSREEDLDKELEFEEEEQIEFEKEEPEDDEEGSEDKNEISMDDLKRENEILKKRIKDTQTKMHEATSRSSELRKELESLREKQLNGDDWFDDDMNNRKEELQSELDKSNESLASIADEMANGIDNEVEKEAQWDKEAEKVKRVHPDFDEVVYEKFAPKLDPNGGDDYIKSEWAKVQDKSPASAYKFAKNMQDMLDMRDDPQAWREREINKIKQQYGSNPTGKQGLDEISSEGYDTHRVASRSRSMVEDVYG